MPLIGTENLKIGPFEPGSNDQEAFFRDYFDNGVVKAQQPDIPKKLMVQRQQIKQGNVKAYEDAIYLKEKNIDINEITNEPYEDIRKAVAVVSDDEIDEEIDNEYWVENEKELQSKVRTDKPPDDSEVLNEKGIQIPIDQKLESYLRIHSINLAPRVREYLKKKQ